MGTLLGREAVFLVPACFYQPITYATAWTIVREVHIEKSVEGHAVALCPATLPGSPLFMSWKLGLVQGYVQRCLLHLVCQAVACEPWGEPPNFLFLGDFPHPQVSYIAAMEHHDESNMGRKEFIWFTRPHHCGSQDRNSEIIDFCEKLKPNIIRLYFTHLYSILVLRNHVL